MLKIKRQTFYSFLCATVVSLAFVKRDDNTDKYHFLKSKGTVQRIIENQRGGFAVIGMAKGKNTDVFFALLDAKGDSVLMETTFKRVGTEGVHGLIQTRDRNYVLAGFQDTLIGNALKRMAWVVKINEKGTVLWAYCDSLGSNSIFKDVVEAPNDDLWLTGESNGRLWIVQINAQGKERQRKMGKAKIIGNGLVWENPHFGGVVLRIVGTETTDEKQQNLVLKAFDTEGGQFLEKVNSTIEKAEGRGIVADDKGNFGIVGTSHRYPRSDVLFALFDRDTGLVQSKSLFFGERYLDDEGLGIAVDSVNNFIIVGQRFQYDGDNKTQAFVQKIIQGDTTASSWIQYFGTAQNDVFQSVVVSESGRVIVVGSFDNGEKTAVTVLDGLGKPFRTQEKSQKETIPQERMTITCKLNNYSFSEGKNDILLPNSVLNDSLTIEIESNQPVKDSDIDVILNGRRHYKYEESRDKGNTGDNKPISQIHVGQTYTFSRRIDFSKASTTVQVCVRGQSQPKKSPVFQVNRRLSKLYILAIGISYDGLRNDSLKLNHTDNDADSIMAIFETQRGFYRDIKKGILKTPDLTTAQAMRDTIATFFEGIDTIDVALLFLSGHGSKYDTTVKIWGSRYDTLDIEAKTYLDYDKDIKKPLNDLERGKRYVFIDACRSLDPIREVDLPVKGNSSSPNYIIKEQREGMNEIMTAKSAYRSLFSCSDTESSFEYPKSDNIKNGFFTHALLEAFGNKGDMNCDENKLCRANMDGNAKLTFEELCNYARRRVPAIAKTWERKQTPFFNSTKQDEDNVPIFIYKK